MPKRERSPEPGAKPRAKPSKSGRADSPDGGAVHTATYQKMTHLEHILHRPGMYVGSTAVEERSEQVAVIIRAPAEEGEEPSKVPLVHVEERRVSVSPANLKIFLEPLSNAVDQAKLDDTVRRIEVNVSGKRVSIMNDGLGVAVKKHEEYGEWIPGMIFGQLLTSSNYDDSEKRVVGGLHGLGVKLTNVFSRWFRVVVRDAVNKLQYEQVWEDNMSRAHPPKVKALRTLVCRRFFRTLVRRRFFCALVCIRVLCACRVCGGLTAPPVPQITPYKNKRGSVLVEYEPGPQVMPEPEFSADVLALMARYALDAAALTPPRVHVSFQARDHSALHICMSWCTQGRHWMASSASAAVCGGESGSAGVQAAQRSGLDAMLNSRHSCMRAMRTSSISFSATGAPRHVCLNSLTRSSVVDPPR